MDTLIIGLSIILILIMIVYYQGYFSLTEYFRIGRKKEKTLLFYFAPWCGYCKNFMPVWNKLKKYRKMYKIDMQAINCDEHPMICKRDDVKSYPTLRLVSDNKIIEYSGDRTLDDLLKFISY